ncbi:hypothetical protein L596_009865 [Steinernema carpocapsae]|uniref:Uncharacterized protein n=1 Tax=Steinernema carpocapsae TaxID=34508 RepID=A0A4U5PGK2_STECR|nr:hypothetical protein L596_009865 [Steinernema carpocapsae]
MGEMVVILNKEEESQEDEEKRGCGVEILSINFRDKDWKENIAKMDMNAENGNIMGFQVSISVDHYAKDNGRSVSLSKEVMDVVPKRVERLVELLKPVSRTTTADEVLHVGIDYSQTMVENVSHGLEASTGKGEGTLGGHREDFRQR